jgi:hypothetical protein
MRTQNSGLTQGAVLMLIGGLAFIGYAVVFLFRNFVGGGFELGVETLNGVTPDNLKALNPAIMHYPARGHGWVHRRHRHRRGCPVLVWRPPRGMVGMDRRRGVPGGRAGGGPALPLHRDLQIRLGHALGRNLRRDPRLRGGRGAGPARDDATDRTCLGFTPGLSRQCCVLVPSLERSRTEIAKDRMPLTVVEELRVIVSCGSRVRRRRDATRGGWRRCPPPAGIRVR